VQSRFQEKLLDTIVDENAILIIKKGESREIK
jgi:hypothetical protein